MAKFQVQTEDGTFEVETADDQPQTMAERASSTVKEMVNYPLGLPANPMRIAGSLPGLSPTGTTTDAYYEMMPRMEKAGADVKEAAGNVLGFLPSDANVGAAVKFGTNLLPFEPSSFSSMAGPNLLRALRGIMPAESAISPGYGKALMENRIPSSAAELRHAEKYGGKTAADIVIENSKLGGSRAEILNNARRGIETLEDQIQSKIKNVSSSKVNPDLSATPPKEIDSSIFTKVFDDAINEASDIPTAAKEVRALKKLKAEYLENAPKSNTVEYWVGLKRKLYQRLGDNAYIKDVSSAQKNVEKSLASSIAREVEKRIPGIKELNRRQGELIRVRDSIIDSSPKEIRDLSLKGPILERATIGAGRFLGKSRKAPNVPFLPQMGVASSLDDHIDEE